MDNKKEMSLESPGTWKIKVGVLLTLCCQNAGHALVASVANILSYFALARVDAALYTVVLQLKILTTAAFSVIFLGRSFSGAKWRALILLVFGCILVASPAFDRDREEDYSATTNTSSLGHVVNVALGIAAILVMVTVSGYTAVYFESMLKKEKISVWERNFQLAFYSVLLLILIITSEMSYQSNNMFGSSENLASTTQLAGGASASAVWFKWPRLFKGWTFNAFLLAVIQAGGGLLVAATLKYADSILKTLATSGSIVLSAILGYLLLGADLDIFVSIGCCCTILAICNYSLDTTD
eukprot:scaffold5256_cov192-Ochromonas_danica.AAC.5